MWRYVRPAPPCLSLGTYLAKVFAHGDAHEVSIVLFIASPPVFRFQTGAGDFMIVSLGLNFPGFTDSSKMNTFALNSRCPFVIYSYVVFSIEKHQTVENV